MSDNKTLIEQLRDTLHKTRVTQYVYADAVRLAALFEEYDKLLNAPGQRVKGLLEDVARLRVRLSNQTARIRGMQQHINKLRVMRHALHNRAQLLEAANAKQASTILEQTKRIGWLEYTLKWVRNYGDVSNKVQKEIEAALKGKTEDAASPSYDELRKSNDELRKSNDELRKSNDELRKLLAEIRDTGLIYWEPQTSRGHVAKATMLHVIDNVLEGQTGEKPEPQPVAYNEMEMQSGLRFLDGEPWIRHREYLVERALAEGRWAQISRDSVKITELKRERAELKEQIKKVVRDLARVS